MSLDGAIHPHWQWFFASGMALYPIPSLVAWPRYIPNLSAFAFHIWAITYRMSSGGAFLQWHCSAVAYGL